MQMYCTSILYIYVYLYRYFSNKQLMNKLKNDILQKNSYKRKKLPVIINARSYWNKQTNK